MLSLIQILLAAFLVWEAVLPAIPKMPHIAYPMLTYGLSYGLLQVPGRWLTPAAVAGALAILHRLFVLATPSVDKRPPPPLPWPKLSFPRRRRRPSGIGRRMPGLP